MGALVLPRAGQPGVLRRPRCAARLPRATLRPLALRAPVHHASVKPKQPLGWRVQQPRCESDHTVVELHWWILVGMQPRVEARGCRRGVQCAGSPKEEEVETLPALTALTESEVSWQWSPHSLLGVTACSLPFQGPRHHLHLECTLGERPPARLTCALLR